MRKAIISIISLALFACNEIKKSENNDKSINYSVNAIKQANWFLGTWQNNTPNGVFTESWEQKNDSLYFGLSTVVVGKDTVFYEKINLQKTHTDWNYVVSVKGQNNKQPIAFKLTSSNPTQLVFENPQHDFPTKITYTQITKDSIIAEISGIVNGVEKKELFPMKRIK